MMFRLEFYKITKLRGSYLLFFVLGLLSKNREPAEKRLRTVIMQIYHFLMLLGHSTITPSPWIKSCKGLLGFALFADKFLMSVATFEVHPWNQFYTLNSIFPCYFLATLKPGRAEQRNPIAYWNTGKLKQNYIIITSNNRSRGTQRGYSSKPLNTALLNVV